MKLTALLASELEELQQGACWIGNNAREIIGDIDFDTALFRASENGNSIWQIINHISYWREVVVKRITGEPFEEGDATGMDIPAEPTEARWQQALQRFEETYMQLHTAISQLPEENVHTILPGNRRTNYNNITGVIQHDAYHLGQVMLLKRMHEKKEN